MSFLKSVWYSAGFSAELGEDPLSRKLLGEPVLLFRTADGSPVAMSNRCPHRFAPLHLGQRVGDGIRCPYHGLLFDSHGQCIENPGSPEPPKHARAKTYPIRDRDGVLWIWMGEPTVADESLIPDYSLQATKPNWATVRGQLHVPANYQLIVDNLMDLSHVAFLHGFLSGGNDSTRITRAEQEGNTVWHRNSRAGPASPLFQALSGRREKIVGDLTSDMRWNAPANMLLANTFAPEDAGGEAIYLHMAHLLTPETENSTHYFWSATRNCQVEDEALSALLKEQVQRAFASEDEPMIVACKDMMDGEDFMALQPIILPGDGAAIRARRLLAKRLRDEERHAVASEGVAH